MKLTKSKQFLADAIHASGKGWPTSVASYAAQCKSDKTVSFYGGTNIPVRAADQWEGTYLGSAFDIPCAKLSPNWHQTVLSREEYFSAYPAPKTISSDRAALTPTVDGVEHEITPYPAEPVADADGWIEWNGGKCPVDGNQVVEVFLRKGRASLDGPKKACRWDWSIEGVGGDIVKYRLHKPDADVVDAEFTPEPQTKHTIEQLAADYRNKLGYANRKQQEADDAKAAADAALGELERAGEALGLLIGIAKPEPELVITDWRDLRVGDIIQCVGSWERENTDGLQLTVTALERDTYEGDLPIRVEVPGISCPGTWGGEFKFIRRP